MRASITPQPMTVRWRFRWMSTCFIVFAGIFAASQPAAALFGHEKQLQERLEQTSRHARQLEAEKKALEQRVKELEQQYLTLSQDHQHVVIDRDNLLAQIKQVQSETRDYEQVKSEHDLLERLLKKSSDAERTLRQELADLEGRLHDVQQALEQTAQDRERLARQLVEAQKHSKEHQLAQELNAQKKEYTELTREFRAAQRELAESQKREAVTEKRSVKLQKDYTASVAENSTLRTQTRTMPKSVEQMARERERLIKESADMHYNLGVLFSENKQYTRAASEFRKVIELRPDDGDAYYNLGVIYAEHLPDQEKAMAHFRRYLTLNPNAKDASWVTQYIASRKAWEAEERLE